MVAISPLFPTGFVSLSETQPMLLLESAGVAVPKQSGQSNFVWGGRSFLLVELEYW